MRPRERLPPRRPRPLGRRERHRLRARPALPPLPAAFNVLVVLLVLLVLAVLVAGLGRAQLAAGGLPVQQPRGAERDRHGPLPERQPDRGEARGLPGAVAVHVQARPVLPARALGLDLQPAPAVHERPAAARRSGPCDTRCATPCHAASLAAARRPGQRPNGDRTVDQSR